MADEEILKEIRDRFREAYDAVDDSYEDMLDDLRFLEGGSTWPDEVRRDREADGRPCLEILKLPTFCDQVSGDMRQNAPSIKVKPVDSGSDPETAEIMTGLIRNIEVQSKAEVAYDTASESSIQCGKGTFRIITDYADDETFDQEIRIQRMKNPFTVYWDPMANEWDRSDAKYCFVTERISREEFGKLYPDASIADHPGGKDKDPHWGDDKSIRVAEYWKRVDDKKKTLYEMRDPLTGNTQMGDAKLEGWEVIRERRIKSSKLQWYKTNGTEILDGPTDWPGKYIPIVEVWGKELNIEGKSVYRGVIRHAKDSQRLYNYNRSHNAEVNALAPKVPYLVTATMIDQYQGLWDKAHKKNYPYLPYNPDPMAQGSGGMPSRQNPIAQNTGLLAEIQIADQEMHDTTGLQQASLGKKSNEQSGRAIMARQREGDVANYAYYDNLARALKYAGTVIVDLIPRIYDSARVIRILGEDGNDQEVAINQPTQSSDGKQKVFDLTAGKYDVIVTIGPSYTSQREEAVDGMIAFMGQLPEQARMIVADLVVKNLDWPGASEFEKRLKALLPPGIAEGDGATPPAPPPPDPIATLDGQAKQADIEGKLMDNRMKRTKAARMEMGLDEGETS